MDNFAALRDQRWSLDSRQSPIVQLRYLDPRVELVLLKILLFEADRAC